MKESDSPVLMSDERRSVHYLNVTRLPASTVKRTSGKFKGNLCDLMRHPGDCRRLAALRCSLRFRGAEVTKWFTEKRVKRLDVTFTERWGAELTVSRSASAHFTLTFEWRRMLPRVRVCVCVGLRRVNHEVCFSEGDGVDLRIFRGSERDRSVRVLTVNLNVTLHLRWRSPGGLWLLLISATRWDKKSFHFLK